MQKLKQTLMLLLILLISVSCKKDFPTIAPQVRCVSVLLEEKIIEGVPYYAGYCRCHSYEWNLDRVGKVGESTNHELVKCNKLIGFEPDVYVNVWTWWEEVRLWLNRNKGK